ncbi:hypothetical protein C2E20_6980 [Micractinium conductrix]|uniref:Uncharacterized protein n=1 Tax=Micractinium conductrix TaxID=554055 RepID=A0A2P6V602_9CHLO|nr:hypothetical protein C2E20_6980 [Micractinium conductrix]|eukprot:PSC69512.1 hypothetical protein C2E20_6980 [Micractinium conductrix]
MQPQAVAASPGASAAAAAAATAAGGPAMAAAPAGVGTRHLGGLWRTSVRQEAACNTYVASISSRYLLEAVPPHERQGGEVGVDAQGWTKWSFPGLSLELAVEIADEAAIWCTMQHELEAGVDPADAARAAADILLEARTLMDTKQRQLLTTSYFARAAGLGGGEAAAAVPAAGRLEEPAVQQQVAAGGAVQQENGEQPLQQHAAAAAVKQEAVVKQEEGEQQQQQQQQQRQRRRLRQDEYGVVHVSGSLTDRERRRWLCRMPPPSHWQPSEGSLDMGLFHDKAAAQHAFRACMAWQELTGQRAEGIVLSAEARALVEGEAYEALIADEELAERLGDLGADGASDLRLDLPSIVEQLMGSQQQQQQQQQPIIPTAAPAAAPAAAPPAAALEDQLAAVLRSSGVGEEGIDAFRSNCHRAEGSAGGVAAFLARFLLPACQAPPAAPLATAPAQNSWMARVAAAAAAAAVAAVMAGAAPAAV